MNAMHPNIFDMVDGNLSQEDQDHLDECRPCQRALQYIHMAAEKLTFGSMQDFMRETRKKCPRSKGILITLFEQEKPLSKQQVDHMHNCPACILVYAMSGRLDDEIPEHEKMPARPMAKKFQKQFQEQLAKLKAKHKKNSKH